MIIWDAFLQYFVMTAERIKIITLIILALMFLLKTIPPLRQFIETLKRIPPKILLFVILVAAFVLRLGWVIWSPHVAPSAGTEDMIMLQHARDLAEGRGYRNVEGAFNADRPVGYALLLAFFIKLFGSNLFPMELLHVVFAVAGVYLIYYLARQITSPAVGLLAAALLALFPTSIFASKIILEENIFIPLWLAGIALLISDLQKPHWNKVVIAGLIFGLAAHFRTQSFAMGLVVFFSWILIKKNLSAAISRAVVLQLFILILALPWAVRNYYRLGEPILYTTWIGAAMYFANNDTADVRYPVNPTLEQGGDLEFSRAAKELERNRAGKKAAMKWIVSHPGVFIQKAVGRMIFMMGLNREGWVVKDNFYNIRTGRQRPSEKFIKKLDKLDNDYYGVIFLFSVMGLILYLFRSKITLQQQSFWVIIFTLLYYFSIVALTPGQRKYRFAIEPFLCLLAAHALILFSSPDEI
ncbi:MAG: glycosyltransferase family 39 protein [Candidatus Omnitrophica bacterium]|nr:glycosyltransferase family 39 protein [Candidatus Omnitrophota bacterium]